MSHSPNLTQFCCLSTLSRPSAQKPASWHCASAVWRSPTKISRNPRKTSCTRSRKERRRGFTCKNRHSRTHLPVNLLLFEAPERVLIYFVHVVSGLSHSLVTIICERQQIKEKEKITLSAVPVVYFAWCNIVSSQQSCRIYRCKLMKALNK